jgi:hypothetical protein
LVLGHLLISGIPTFKSYTNTPGYDLIATNPKAKRSVRIQVKSRQRIGAHGFPIKNFDSDFVVIALLNVRSKGEKAEIRAPQFYVLPIDVVKVLPRSAGVGNITFSKIQQFESYREKWDLIAADLGFS